MSTIVQKIAQRAEQRAIEKYQIEIARRLLTERSELSEADLIA